ncbi:MAG: class I SAM-dependent methyltransferase [Anaerolineaceae bacterium]|nr:class I SAM-dependent methyltransferase [Anaerolineaceae bacterium]
MGKFNHFSFLAPRYEKYIEPKIPEKLISLAKLPVEGHLLDAGGGTGRVAQYLTAYAEKVILADQSFTMTQEAYRKNSLFPACSESEHLPFSSNFFTRIIMVDALHHVNHHKNTLDELWRVLQPGGLLIIEEPDIRHMRVKFIALAEKLALMRSHFLTPNKIAALLPFPQASIQIEHEDTTAWIIAKKQILS